MSSHREKEKILRRGWIGQYDNIFDTLPVEVTADVTEEIHDILEMFTAISLQLETLSAQEKEQFDLNKLSFRGFDANHDPHFQQLKFMVEDQHLYDELKGQDLRSHTQTTFMQYRRQVPVYKRLRNSGQELTAQDLVEIANA